jgi:hypothetical protein
LILDQQKNLREEETKSFLPLFLTSRALRTTLQNMYVLMVGSNENAMMLLEKDPCDINSLIRKGNERVRQCFSAGASWLSLGRQFAVTDEIFSEQILELTRCAARFITNIRTLSSSTT